MTISAPAVSPVFSQSRSVGTVLLGTVLLGTVLLGTVLLGTVLLGCGPEGASGPSAPGAASSSEAATSTPSAVTALGRLEPGWGVVDVGAPAGDRVAELAVREGDPVAVGDLLARLDSHELRAAELGVRRAGLNEAREELQRAEELMPLAIRAREAAVARIEADLELAEADLRRTRALVGDEVLPPRELEYRQSLAAQTRAQLDQARTDLELEKRSRRLDIRAFRARLRSAEAAVSSAEAELRRTEILSPVDGTVLRLEVLEGEPTVGGPILRLGETGKMLAVAEVYESDARFVRQGQAATITSPALPGPLRGTVERMGSLVDENDVLSLDPRADRDARVIEARILLDDAATAARFVHLQVDVRIETDGTPSDGNP